MSLALCRVVMSLQRRPEGRGVFAFVLRDNRLSREMLCVPYVTQRGHLRSRWTTTGHDDLHLSYAAARGTPEFPALTAGSTFALSRGGYPGLFVGNHFQVSMICSCTLIASMLKVRGASVILLTYNYATKSYVILLSKCTHLFYLSFV